MPGVFENFYKKLNVEQKTAVDYLEGPLLVIAGPGTGKTQLLSLRAANILRMTDALAENILCLTYTESAANEMRTRLIDIIGDDAYKITVSTYHGFGSEIISSYPSYFGGNNLRPVTELKIDSLIREIQKTLVFSNSLKEPEMTARLSSLISDAKQADLQPQDLIKIANDNISFISMMSKISSKLTPDINRISLKSVANFKKLLATDNDATYKHVDTLASLWNSELDEAIEEAELTKKTAALSHWKAKYLTRDQHDQYVVRGLDQNKRLLDFSEIYKKYDQELQDSGLYDYDDMILKSIDALKNNDELRFNLQEKYQYIMLDEYQDTNLAQAELIELLTNNPASEGQPNVMAVGDDDQAIFAFQGARHSNMLDFINAYKNVKQITLKTNYRSTQDIIDLSASVSNQIKERLSDLTNMPKDFKAEANEQGQITSLKFANEVEQYIWLANNLTTNKKSSVISPQHKYLERASAYLIDKDLKISYDRRENILEDPLIKQIITFLKLLQAINDNNSYLVDSLMSKVLNFDFWQFKTESIWQLSWQAHDKHQPWLDMMMVKTQTKTTALMFIKMAANALIYRFDFIIDQVLGLSDVVINDSKQKATRSPFIDYYKDEQVRLNLFQNLLTLKEEFTNFNSDNTKPLMVADLLDFVSELESSKIKIVSATNTMESEEGITLTTAHSAKGQEFDNVYLISFINEAWGPKNNNQYISLPPNLSFIRSHADDVDDEKLRLLYVSLTRAKHMVYVLSYSQSVEGKAVNPLKYLNPPNEKQLKAQVDLRPLWQNDKALMKLQPNLKSLLKKRLENYALNASDLNTFIDVRHAGPQNFFNQVLLKYREPVAARVDYGSAIHDSLNWLQQSLIAANKLPSLNNLIREFETNLSKRRLVEHEFERYKAQGISTLTKYYNQKKTSFSVDDMSEYDFRNQGLTIDGFRITGKIDKLIVDKSNKLLTIVDYKTGQGEGSWRALPKLHRYINQLYFYKLLADNSSAFREYKTNQAIVDFVEPDKYTNELSMLTLEYNDEDMARFIMLLKAVATHVKELNFPDVSSYSENLKGIIKFEDDLINGRI